VSHGEHIYEIKFNREKNYWKFVRSVSVEVAPMDVYFGDP